MPTEYIVESDITIRAVDKPFPEKQLVATFDNLEMAYTFVKKNLEDTKSLHNYFCRFTLIPYDEVQGRVKENRAVAYNCVLGQFEDVIYIRESTN
jgi:hypothetical protein